MNKLRGASVWILLVCLSAWMLSSCSNSKRLAKGKPLRKHSSGILINKNKKVDFDFEWVGMKMSIDFESPEQSQDFKATVRIRKDSIIWLSIAPAANIEMIRMVITPDSVKYISKVPNNKHYFLGTFEKISDVAQMELDFGLLQDILIGNAIFLDKQEDNYNNIIDDQQYCVLAKFSRKLKKIVGVDEKDVLPNTQFSIAPSEKKYERLKSRADFDEITVKRFWLNGYNFKLERALFNDFYYNRDIELNYSDFKEEDGQLYPAKGRFKVTSADTWQDLQFKITRMSINKPYEIEFDIPENYDRRWE